MLCHGGRLSHLGVSARLILAALRGCRVQMVMAVRGHAGGQAVMDLRRGCKDHMGNLWLRSWRLGSPSKHQTYGVKRWKGRMLHPRDLKRSSGKSGALEGLTQRATLTPHISTCSEELQQVAVRSENGSTAAPRQAQKIPRGVLSPKTQRREVELYQSVWARCQVRLSVGRDSNNLKLRTRWLAGDLGSRDRCPF